MPTGSRTRERRRRRPATADRRERKVNYRQLTNPLVPQALMSNDEVGAVHDTALRVLEELGIRVLEPTAVEVLLNAGATQHPQSGLIHLDRVMVENALASAPSQFTLHGGDSKRDVQVGGKNLIFTPVGGPPHASDCERGRRPGTYADMVEFFKLSQSFDVLHLLSPCVEPQDIDIKVRHLKTTAAELTLSDKSPFIYCRGPGQVADCFEMVRIARGLDEDTFVNRPVCHSVVNTNSPRQLDVPMCQGIMDFARAGQVCIITPFTLSGAMAPVTIAGALVLQHAEAMAGITLSQTVRPGAPVVYGAFTSNVDMKSGAPAFGTPEYVKGSFGAGQLARKIGLPWRGSSPTASNAPDVQGSYETLMSAWSSLLGGVNVMLHAAGWLEGGLTASLEKFILDVEALQIFAEICTPLDASPAELGFDAIAEVQPGGHFFSAAHTMERYSSAFYEPMVADWRNVGQWTEAGAQTATQRATGLWKATLNTFEAPTLDIAVTEALADFERRRTAEGGSAPV